MPTLKDGSLAPEGVLGLEDREIANYSLFKVLRALAEHQLNGTDPGKVAPFEMRCSRLLEDRYGLGARGCFVPLDVTESGGWAMSPAVRDRAAEIGLLTRTPPMGVGTTGTVGAGLVGTTHLASSFIEALRPASVVIASGAQLLPGLVGDVSIPKQTGRAGFTWLAEDEDSVDTETPIGLLNMSPKTVSGSVPITRKLLKQSAPAVEQLVRSDLVSGAAEAIDDAALEGSGSANEPLGVVGTTGVLTTSVSSAGNPTWAETVAFETAVAAQNALRQGGAYVTTPAVVGNMKVRTKETGSGKFVLEDGMANGYPVRSTSQLTANTIIFGGWSQVLIGMWGVLDVMLDTATKAASGGLVVRVFQDVDVALRHSQAFCIPA